ncbi:TPA: ATP-binding cassette domain-containing protein [Corynebacterium striatum]|nr:ATP-binding cassette domain-containing protein [Corynebacterium striatum]
MIEIDSLAFSYAAKKVLGGVDLHVDSGEVVCLLGPNGVGKTTLLENIVGTLTPTAGRVCVFGQDPRRVKAGFWSRVGLVQQNWSDHPKWRVKDQLAWVAGIHETHSPAAMGVEQALELVSLGDKENQKMDLTPVWWTPDIQPGWVGKKGKLPPCLGTPNSSNVMLWPSMKTMRTSR